MKRMIASVVLVLCAFNALTAEPVHPEAAKPLLDAGVERIVFIKRLTYSANHYYTEYINSRWTPGGNLCTFDVKSGAVEVSRNEDETEHALGTVNPGDVVGVVSVIRSERRLVTASAVGETYLYRMNLNRLMASAGGEDQPASIVLRSLADTVKSLAEDVLATRRTEPISDRRI